MNDIPQNLVTQWNSALRKSCTLPHICCDDCLGGFVFYVCVWTNSLIHDFVRLSSQFAFRTVSALMLEPSSFCLLQTTALYLNCRQFPSVLPHDFECYAPPLGLAPTLIEFRRKRRRRTASNCIPKIGEGGVSMYRNRSRRKFTVYQGL